jgi:hypothetical protein
MLWCLLAYINADGDHKILNVGIMSDLVTLWAHLFNIILDGRMFFMTQRR